MRSLVMLPVVAALALAAQPSQALLPAVNNWIEFGDAGGPAHPQIMFGDGSVRQIGGNIGDTDLIDVFTFQLGNPGAAAGIIAILPQTVAARVEFDLPAGTPEPDVNLFLHLLDEHGRLLAVGDGSVRVENLLPGLYHIGVSTFDVDPPYVITFDLGDVRFVPEPASLALLGLGLAGLAFSRRRAEKNC